MTELEDLVRRTMRAHEDDAPTTAEFRPRSVHRSGRWVAVAAAAACVLVLAGVLLAVTHRTGRHEVAGPTTPADTSAVLSCPQTYAPGAGVWVPEPAKGVDGKSRLVPQALPGHVVVCAYLNTTSGVLTADRQLTGDLSIIPVTFSWLPHADPSSSPCESEGPGRVPGTYLFGISYPGGTIWVSAPVQACDGASNGQFEAADNLSTYAHDALATGTWQLDGQRTVNGCPDPTTGGRLGQETALVPDDPISVQVCELHDSSPSATVLGKVVTGAALGSFTAALNALPTQPRTFRHCLAGLASDSTYVVAFDYQLGPPVLITANPRCGDQVTNGSIEVASDAASALALIQGLLPR